MDTREHFGDQTPDVLVHERTYHAFSLLTRWAMLVLGDLILWLTLWFASPAGFLRGTLIAIVAFVLGYQILIRHEEKQPLDVWAQGR